MAFSEAEVSAYETFFWRQFGVALLLYNRTLLGTIDPTRLEALAPIQTAGVLLGMRVEGAILRLIRYCEAHDLAVAWTPELAELLLLTVQELLAEPVTEAERAALHELQALAGS